MYLRISGVAIIFMSGLLSPAQDNLPEAPGPVVAVRQPSTHSLSRQSGAKPPAQDALAFDSSANMLEDRLNDEQHQRVFGIMPNFYTVYGPNAAPLTIKQKFHLAWKSELDPENLGILALNAAMEKPMPKRHEGIIARHYPDRLAIDWAQDMGGLLIGKVLLSSAFHEDPRFFYRDDRSRCSRIWYSVWADFTTRNDSGRIEPAYSGFASEIVSHASVNLFYKPVQRIPVRTILKEILMDRLSGIGDNLAQEFVFNRFRSKSRHNESVDSFH